MAKHPAAYPHRVNKVTISGHCFNGAEEWSTGFYVGSESGDAVDPGSVAAAAIAGLWTTFFTSANAHIAGTYVTNSIKVSQLETDGDVDLDMIDIYDYPAAIAGVSGGAPLPPQITLAATLSSDIQRGLASKGRMYLPGINLPVVPTDPRIAVVEQGQIATQLKTFFDGVNASSDVPGSVILASKGRKFINTQAPDDYNYVAGVIKNVTGLRLGNVYDTQRRRRNGIAESYINKVLA
jgi:hypothetical protein